MCTRPVQCVDHNGEVNHSLGRLCSKIHHYHWPGGIEHAWEHWTCMITIGTLCIVSELLSLRGDRVTNNQVCLTLIYAFFTDLESAT